MWIFMNDSMLSVVEDRYDPEILLVRSRIEGDIERVFPDAIIDDFSGEDYRYRTWIEREMVAKAIFDRISNINYGNFKDSVNKADVGRKRLYSKVWLEGALYQDLHDEREPRFNDVDDDYFQSPIKDKDYYEQVFKLGKANGRWAKT